VQYRYIRVVEVNGRTARVRAVSERVVDGEPEARIELVVRTANPIDQREAKKIALMYLDLP
jgi:hypothetical protein